MITGLGYALTPRTVPEAVACGRAIVTTDASGRPETMAPGVKGFLVPVGAAPALALAIERLVLKPELVLATGAGRRALAAQQYDARRINAVMLQARGLA